MGKEGEKGNSLNFVQVTIEGWKSYPRRNGTALITSVFLALGGLSEFVIVGNEKNAILFGTVALLLTGTSLVDAITEGRVIQRDEKAKNQNN